MPPLPRLVMLVHGGPEGIEAARARGLADGWPQDEIRFLFRERDRKSTLLEWRQALDEFKPRLVYVINTAMPGSALAPEWCSRNKVPFIIDTGDAVYAMARRAGTTPWWKQPLLWLFERHVQRRANAIVVRGTKHQSLLKAQGHKKVEVIRDGYLPSPDFDTSTLSTLRAKLGLNDCFVAGILGSLVFSPRLRICYGWDLIEALALLKDLPVRGLIIGDGNGLDWLKTKAAEAGVTDRIVFTGRIPYAEVPLYLRLMDVALSTQTNNLPGQVRTTGKLPEYMATGRYVLASRVGDAELLLPGPMLIDYDGEVDHTYPGRLAKTIRHLFTHPEALALRDSLPAIAREHCSYPVLAGRFRDVVCDATTGGSES